MVNNMQLIDFCGNEINIVFSSHKNPIRGDNSRSIFQKDCGLLLKEKFPYYTILEEWIIPRSNGLSFDFFIPDIMIAVECQGEQHIKFSKFFHGTIDKFIAQKKRDRAKKDWCLINQIKLVEIFNVKEFEEKING